MMYTAEKVRKEAEALDAGRIRERDAKEMLLAFADLLEAMDGFMHPQNVSFVAALRQRAAEKARHRK